MSVFMNMSRKYCEIFCGYEILVFIKIDILVGTVFTTNILEVGIKKKK